MKPTFYFLLGIFTCVLAGTKDQAPKGEDYIKQQINAGIKQATQTKLREAISLDSPIVHNTKLTLAAMKRITQENDSLKYVLSKLKKENTFYKEVASNPVIITKPEYANDYAVQEVRIDTVYYKINIFGKAKEISKKP